MVRTCDLDVSWTPHARHVHLKGDVEQNQTMLEGLYTVHRNNRSPRATLLNAWSNQSSTAKSLVVDGARSLVMW